MAKPARKHPENVPGPWFVDDTCIDCDASRQCAPEIFGVRGGQSVIIRQPETEEEVRRTVRAMLVCPTGSIGVEGSKPDTGGLLPLELDPGIFLCGFNSRKSYGAHSFFVRHASGNFLIDAPRFVNHLVRTFESSGGLQDIFLSHRDDVADADRYAAHFGARVWIHEFDRGAAPYATDILRGTARHRIRDDLTAIPVPGHTRGSVVYHLENRYLFTGDSLYWSRTLADLSAIRSVCWYSWDELTRSLESLLDLSFEWVLAGHGGHHHAPADVMRASLARLVERMKQNDPALAGNGAMPW